MKGEQLRAFREAVAARRAWMQDDARYAESLRLYEAYRTVFAVFPADTARCQRRICRAIVRWSKQT